MTLNDGFDRTVSDWLHEEAGSGAPGYLDEVLTRSSGTRQRPAWSSLERWLPVDLAYRARVAPNPRLILALALVALLILSAALLLIAGVGQGPLPHFGARANGQIAFVDGSSIRFAGADGVVGPLVIGVPGGTEQLAFSPDGTRLAYRTIDASMPSIVVADSNGSHPIAAVSGASLVPGEALAWSPDSGRIAFAEFAGAGEKIIVIDSDGSHRRALITIAATSALDLTWSPDGQWIAFFSAGANGSATLIVIHPDGSGERTLNTASVKQDGLTWSPDPEVLRVAYVSPLEPGLTTPPQPGIRRAFVKVYDFSTASESTVSETSILTGSAPSWSPDGTRISWWNDGIHVVSVADALAGHANPSTVLPVVRSGCLDHPELAGKAICGSTQWSPDSRWLYGVDIVGTSIVFGRVDGGSSSHAIALGHPVNNGAIYGRQASWQAVAP